VQPLRNFSGGFVGESENADSGRVDVELLDQKANALDQAESLAGAGTGENEQWLWCRFDRRKLTRRRIRPSGNRSGVGCDRRRCSIKCCVLVRGVVRASRCGGQGPVR